MLGSGLRLMTSMAMAGVEVAVDAGRLVGADDLFDLRPRQIRRLLLSFEDSIHGNIPEILGEDEEERVDTLVRLLRGTSEKDLSTLIGDLQTALIPPGPRAPPDGEKDREAPPASVLARRLEEPTG
jgi:hypothetical protein